MKGDWRVSLPREAVERGNNPARAAFTKDPAKIAGAWYERQITVPESWAGREIRLNFGRVGTDALIWIDDREAGMIGFQGGQMDVGAFLTPGKTVRLRVLVIASRKEIKDIGFNKRDIPADPSDCAATGITGDVVLTSQPPRVRVENVRVDTSTHRRELALQVSFGHTPAQAIGQACEFTVKVRKAQGREALSFTSNAVVGEDAVARFSHPWPDPHLWDTDNPFLYQLTLQVKGLGIEDEVVVPQFGFREFWTEGRDLFMNDSLIRLRPGESSAASNVEAIRADFARRRHQGCNILEVWPQSTNERGYTHFHNLYAQIASQEGMLLMMPTAKLNDFFSKRQEGLTPWIKEVQRKWLAWLAGNPEDFTEKSHHFESGGTLQKSAALINDTRREQPFTASWKLTDGDTLLLTESTNGSLAIGEIRLNPITLRLPVIAAKTALILSMEAKIGDTIHRDTFPLRVWPAAPAAQLTDIRVLDPVGKSRQLPGLSGIPDGRDPEKPAQLSVIGRESLSGGDCRWNTSQTFRWKLLPARRSSSWRSSLNGRSAGGGSTSPGTPCDRHGPSTRRMRYGRALMRKICGIGAAPARS